MQPIWGTQNRLSEGPFCVNKVEPEKIKLVFFFFFCTGPFPGLLPVLGPLGSGTDATHQPGPPLRLLGCW